MRQMQQKPSNIPYQLGYLIDLKDESWLKRQRIAGKVAANALSLLEKLVKGKTIKSLIELDNIAGEYIVANGCEITFHNFHGFPGKICISVNNAIVHGIATDYKLQEGDIVSFDLGATYEGAIADTALTVIYGDPKKEEHLRLIQETENALMKGIEAISIGKQLGVIGEAVYKHSQDAGFGCITHYGGHGISYNKPHADPFVHNRALPNEGIRIMSGLSIAIEPMLIVGDTATWIGKDGWTVYGSGMSSHAEHSIFVHSDRVEIITAREVASNG